MAQTRGIRIHQYLDDWLLRVLCQETCRQHTQTLLALCRDLGWVVNIKKSELIPVADFQFRQLPVQTVDRSGVTNSRKMVGTTTESPDYQEPGKLYSQTVHVPNGPVDSHRKTGLVRLPSYETHTVASEVSLAHFGGFGEDNSGAQISSPTSGLLCHCLQMPQTKT